MYYNSNGERVSRARWKEMYQAFQNRQELIKAGLTSRRDLMRLGLLTAAGTLIPMRGLSWGDNNCRYGSTGCGNCASPPTTPWTMAMPISPVKQAIPLSSLTGPAPSINPNAAINPATGLAYEGRTRAHQAPPLGFPFPTTTVYQVSQQAAQIQVSQQLPVQTLWTFDGVSPGPTELEGVYALNWASNIWADTLV